MAHRGGDDTTIIRATTATPDATPVDLIVRELPTNSAREVSARVVAIRTDSTKRAVYRRTATFWRAGAGATMGSQYVPLPDDLSGAPAWTVDLLASGSDAVLRITGAAAEDVRWQVTMDVVSVEA